MKLLFDQNISRKIILKLKNHFPKSEHVVDLGLENLSDKIIWIRSFDQTTSFVEQLLIEYHSSISLFVDENNLACLELKQLQ